MIKKTVEVTEEIIRKGHENIYDVEECIGALVLLELLKDEYSNEFFVEWGNEFGFSKENKEFGENEEGNRYFISIDEDGDFVEMMEIASPTKVIIQEISFEEYNQITP